MRYTALAGLRAWLIVPALGISVGCGTTADAPETGSAQDADERGEIAAEEVEPTEPEQHADPQGVETQRTEAEARGLDPEDPLDAAILEEEDSPLEVRRVQFAFDSSEIRDEAIPVLEAHGTFLAEHPDQRMTIEGHTDERGSRAYNLALGERRAEAVARMLRANGARPDQLEIVSYGEEEPLVPESNEAAWAKNRRAELVYEG